MENKLRMLENALVTLLEFVSHLKPHQVDAALTEMDLSDEGFEEELQIVKDSIGWVDEPVETPLEDK